MSEFKPVETVADLNHLDEAEMVSGYWSGYAGDPEPGSDKSRSFWHGWRNGRVDGKHQQKDASQAKLAREYVGTYKGLN